ncbi:MAG: integrase [Frankiaceae bacterium]
MLIEKGQNPKVIQARLGHASIEETFDTYGHLFPADEDRTRQAIDDAFGELPEDGTSEGQGGLSGS